MPDARKTASRFLIHGKVFMRLRDGSGIIQSVQIKSILRVIGFAVKSEIEFGAFQD